MVCVEDMEEELEWFDEPPSFSDLCVCLKRKFGGDFTLKGRFDSGKTRAHYVLMPLRDHAHWSRYNRVIQCSNVAMAEVWWRMGTGCMVSRRGRPSTVVLNKNVGSMWNQLWVLWIWTVS